MKSATYIVKLSCFKVKENYAYARIYEIEQKYNLKKFSLVGRRDRSRYNRHVTSYECNIIFNNLGEGCVTCGLRREIL